MAALTIPDTGNATTISGLGITTQVVSIDGYTIGQDPIEISHLGTTGFKSFRPTDLRNMVEVKWTFNWLGTDIAAAIGTTMITTTEPYAGTAFTIQYPAAGSITGKAFVKSIDLPSAKNGEIMQGSCTIVFDGSGGTNNPTYTAP
jgi:hypothetical protein